MANTNTNASASRSSRELGGVEYRIQDKRRINSEGTRGVFNPTSPAKCSTPGCNFSNTSTSGSGKSPPVLCYLAPRTTSPCSVERFFRLDPARTQNRPALGTAETATPATTGAGLGLAIARWIAEEHIMAGSYLCTRMLPAARLRHFCPQMAPPRPNRRTLRAPTAKPRVEPMEYPRKRQIG
jgi:hypothetical protein